MVTVAYVALDAVRVAADTSNRAQNFPFKRPVWALECHCYRRTDQLELVLHHEQPVHQPTDGAHEKSWTHIVVKPNTYKT